MPKPQAMEENEATSMICSAMEMMLGALVDVAPFTNCAVMSAAVHIAVDAGMVAVLAGATSRDDLADVICSAVRQCIKEFAPDHGQHGTMQ